MEWMDANTVKRMICEAGDESPVDGAAVELFAPLLIHRFEPVPVEELDTPVDFQHISRVCIRRGRFSCFFDLDLNLKLNTPHLYCNKIQYA